MLKLRHALLASLCLLPLAATDALAATAGVTAAVNQSAKSTPPGGGVRTVVLGANIVQDETIETDGAGLVQILLADGTTFTVGPNSAITIDRFVYDPDANTAQVSATIGRGVFRFIGGRTSKTEGGVQLNTPVGTVGIRGGMADLNFTGAGQIDLLFGNEVTLNGPNGSNRIFQPGYSIVFGANGQPTVIKTPPGSANFIQQALAGRPGTSGGSSQKPTDGKVANSGVPGSNSGSNPPGQQIPPPDLRAIDLATPKPNDNHQVAENVKDKMPTTLSGTYHGYSSAYVVRTGGTGPDVEAFYRNILPDTEISFDPASRTYGGHIKVSDGTSYPPAGVLEVAFGSPVGDSFYYNDFVYYGTGPASAVTFDGIQPGTGNSGSTAAAAIGLGSADCECSFIQLGYFATGLDDPTIGELTAIGTFVTGSLSNEADYEIAKLAYGNASYDGLAFGFLTRNGVTGGAYGSMHMDFDFSDREGWMQISDFGDEDIDFGGYIYGNGQPNGSDPTFYGTSADQPGPEFQADGSFVNSGSNAGAGVIGNFTASDTDWSATGVFGGIYTGLPSNNY